MHCGDTRQISGMYLAVGPPLRGPAVGRRGPRGTIGPVIFLHQVSAVLVVGIAELVLVLIFVAVVVLYQAEIDRHLAHRAGHLLSSVSRLGSPAHARCLRRTLPDEGSPAAEQRRTNAYVCRAFRDCFAQVTAHAGG